MLLERSLAIAPAETTGSLHDRLAALGATLIVEALHQAGSGQLAPRAQAADGATYAHKIAKTEADIDWRLPAAAIERKLRALDPAPGASSRLGGELVKVWRAQVLPDHSGTPGEILEAGDAGLVVACGSGALRVTELQRPGGRRVPAAAFVAACRAAQPGACFERAAGED
jgi:methionyl-tRNA formyltransferase